MFKETVDDVEMMQFDLVFFGESFDGGRNSDVEAVDDALERRRQFYVFRTWRTNAEVHHVPGRWKR